MNQSTGLKLLCVTVFLLAGMPQLNVRVGPVPLYAIDILLFVTFCYALGTQVADRRRNPFAGYIMIILFFAIAGEVATILTYGKALQPIYLIVRELLAFSLFFSASRIVQTSEDIQTVLKAGLLGLLITAVLMITSSMPPTRSIAVAFFSFNMLVPASEELSRAFGVFGPPGGMRGQSLVGMSILSGAFLNTFWPMVALLYRWPGLGGWWKKLALAGTVLAPIGVVMGYSRGALVGLIFVVAGLMLFGSGRNRRGVIISVLLGLTIFSTVGWNSNLFFFDRIENRVTAMIDDPYKDPRETERLYSYTEPFKHVIKHPRFFFVGEGLSVRKIPESFGGERAGKNYHSLFASAYYAYGMIAAFIYVFFIFRIFFFVWQQIRRFSGTNSIPLLYSQALFAAMLGMLPWLLLGHAVVTLPRGTELFCLLVGLIAALKKFQVKVNVPATT